MDTNVYMNVSVRSPFRNIIIISSTKYLNGCNWVIQNELLILTIGIVDNRYDEK